MKDVPLLDELRATRRRLAEELELDAERYAAMLRGVAQTSAGEYVTEPFLPPDDKVGRFRRSDPSRNAPKPVDPVAVRGYHNSAIV